MKHTIEYCGKVSNDKFISDYKTISDDKFNKYILDALQEFELAQDADYDRVLAATLASINETYTNDSNYRNDNEVVANLMLFSPDVFIESIFNFVFLLQNIIDYDLSCSSNNYKDAYQSVIDLLTNVINILKNDNIRHLNCSKIAGFFANLKGGKPFRNISYYDSNKNDKFYCIQNLSNKTNSNGFLGNLFWLGMFTKRLCSIYNGQLGFDMTQLSENIINISDILFPNKIARTNKEYIFDTNIEFKDILSYIPKKINAINNLNNSKIRIWQK